jgi:hypothetical protein
MVMVMEPMADGRSIVLSYLERESEGRAREDRGVILFAYVC